LRSSRGRPPHDGRAAQAPELHGITGVGWDPETRAGKKKVVLELGGNAACVVDEDADLKDTVDRITAASKTAVSVARASASRWRT